MDNSNDRLVGFKEDNNKLFADQNKKKQKEKKPLMKSYLDQDLDDEFDVIRSMN